jgi:hypothetical protein
MYEILRLSKPFHTFQSTPYAEVAGIIQRNVLSIEGKSG